MQLHLSLLLIRKHPAGQFRGMFCEEGGKGLGGIFTRTLVIFGPQRQSKGGPALQADRDGW
jgi:hypothetical protein